MTCHPDLWQTRDGQRIPPHDMTTSHLRNAIRFFEDIEDQEIPNTSEIHDLSMLRDELERREPTATTEES